MSAPVIRIYRTPFCAESERTGPLSWAQQAMRGCIEWLGEDSHFFSMPVMLAVPRTVSVADVARAVASLTERHEALRTRFVDEDGEPIQRVSATGSLTLRVFDFDIAGSGPEQDGALEDHAESLVAAVRSIPFNGAAEWPVRFVLITARGRPHRLALVAFHLAVDGVGLEICAQELRETMNGAEAGDGTAWTANGRGAPVWHPIDQARHERGPYGAWVNERAVAHWRNELHKVPVPLFTPPSTPPAERTGEPRIEVIGLVSYATAAANLIVARESGTTTATVMLAATAAMLSRFTGHRRVPIVLAAGNRFRKETKDSVTLLVQDALMTLEAGERTFADVLADATTSSLVAYSAGHYDPALIRRLRAEVAGERGVAAVDTSAYFNDLSFPGWQESVPDGLSRTEVTDLQAHSLPIVISSWPRQDSTLFVHCRYSRGACVLVAVTDTALFPLPRARAFLRAIEDLVVRAAFEEVSADCITEIAASRREQEEDGGQLSRSGSS
jgi:hypothetical protein